MRAGEVRLRAERVVPQPAGGVQQLVVVCLHGHVHHAHEQGILHRDLKPSNILLTRDTQPKICDFGVAKFLTGSDHKTLSGMILGTAAYMAPEQARGKVVDRRADIWAFGVVLFEMLAGQQLFAAGDTVTDHQFVTPAGDGMHITVTDLTTGHSGTIVLDAKGGDGPLMPAFDTQTLGNALSWGIVNDAPA